MRFLIIISLIILGNFTNLFADERKLELNRLFNDLKINNSSLSHEVEQKIWKLWSTHPNDKNLT